MRLAQVGPGSGVGLPGVSYTGTILARSASKIFPAPETPDNYRYLDPMERSI